MDKKNKVDFGFSWVDKGAKVHKVHEVFDRVSSYYDLMNDAMSLGVHRLWKRRLIEAARIEPSHDVLDVATGSGDVARLIAKHLRAEGSLIASDINQSMLDKARARLIDSGYFGPNVRFALEDAETLSFPDDSFDRITLAFGLRNMTDKPKALGSMLRVLKPGGRLAILEFSHVDPLLKPCYDWYSFRVIPKLGALFSKDEASYQYLVESIRKHPDQTTLKSMMEDQGFIHASYRNLQGGIVAIHLGHKPL